MVITDGVFLPKKLKVTIEEPSATLVPELYICEVVDGRLLYPVQCLAIVQGPYHRERTQDATI